MKNELINSIITPILEKGKFKFLEIQRFKRLDGVTKFTDGRSMIQIQIYMNIQSLWTRGAFHLIE